MEIIHHLGLCLYPVRAQAASVLLEERNPLEMERANSYIWLECFPPNNL